MAKEQETSEAVTMNPHRSKIGGQALIEGVMMKGVKKGAMACRLPDGTIDVEVWELKHSQSWLTKTPFIRGIYNFLTSMIDGYRCLMKSAEKQMTEEELAEEEELSKIEQWLEDHLGEKLFQAIMVVGMVLGVVLAMGLFFYVPKAIVNAISILSVNRIVRSFSEGIIKIILFVLYMWVTAFSKDVRRTYEYHGAEHKTIACLEAGLPLTVENVKQQCRLHPRCGTSFIFLVLFISILVMCCVPFTETLPRFLCSIFLLPVTVGASYECIRFAGRSDSRIAKALSFPGLQLQKITTREPDGEEIECAIAAMLPCIPEDESEDIW